jgi:hypothetical protein
VADRDTQGRFVKGHSKTGGRKSRTEEETIIAALDGACPLDQVLGKLRDAVLMGEDWAIKLYLAYYWHLPTQPVKGDLGIEGGLTIKVKLPDAR